MMRWITLQEQRTLAGLGLLALVGLSLVLWRQQHPPLQIEAGPPPSYEAWDQALTAARQVDLNQATREQLERLPEIGPSTAQRILDYRAAHGRFSRPEELTDVPGIGPKTFEQVREYITVQ